MATIEMKQVEKIFGESYAVKPLDLTIEDGEFIVFLGPSGCGKTTTMRMISGLEAVTGGRIFLDGQDVTWRKPSDRNIAFVFQFFALYPHMTVRENIVFPLQAEGQGRQYINERLESVISLLRIDRNMLDRRPGQLSGGDKQRVALARALVRKPAAFLMDEPLGALDAEFREAMRAEIKQLHIKSGATTVYVTHDQVEAMAMGDRIVVMSAAEIQQVGTPAEVYYDPANLFVARFIGSPGMNLLSGHYTDGKVNLSNDNVMTVPAFWKSTLDHNLNEDGEVIVGFRPEAALISNEGELGGEIYASDLHGAYAMLHVSPDGSGEEIAHIRSDRGLRLKIGTPVKFDVKPDMVRFFDPSTELTILREE